ncbi:MAG TPA: sigma-70 family RNA polymerase sigma factor [Candidatus Sulfotelmatobacter sp.]|nr:sigma-70 family RNA polymerase sigma factor [Candidatus Sulfotelmatobacter sp.]
MAQTDFDIIDRCLAGDEGAFDHLVRKYQREVFQLAYRITRNGEDAKDLAQDAFVQAYRSLKGFQRKSGFYTWLYRITVNLCLNHLKGAARVDPAEVDDRVPDTREHALDVLTRDERDRAVAEAIASLPPQQRATLTLRVHQGLSHKEIAEVLDCSEGTAKANYFHAVRGLQARLARFRDVG